MDTVMWDAIPFTLLPAVWLDSQPMDLFSVLDCQTSNKIACVPSQAYGWYVGGIRNGDRTPSVYDFGRLRAVEMLSKSAWVVMINKDNIHRQLICILNPGRPGSIALLMDSLVTSGDEQTRPSNWETVQSFVQYYVNVICIAAEGRVQATGRPYMRQCLVPHQPNYFDCGVFSLLNLKNVVCHVDALLALTTTSQPGVLDFCWWYNSRVGTQYRYHLFQRYGELLDKYSEPSSTE